MKNEEEKTSLYKDQKSGATHTKTKKSTHTKHHVDKNQSNNYLTI